MCIVIKHIDGSGVRVPMRTRMELAQEQLICIAKVVRQLKHTNCAHVCLQLYRIDHITLVNVLTFACLGLLHAMGKVAIGALPASRLMRGSLRCQRGKLVRAQGPLP